MTVPEISWPAPAALPALEREAIHVWCAWLDDPALSRRPEELLSADELARARSFHFETDRRRFVAARTVLRRLLGAYLEQEPARLQFIYGPYGKPALNPAWLRFNLSHCGPLALFAIARHKEVGVDLEETRELPDLPLVESRVFSAAEAAHQQSLPPAVRRHDFYRRWTRKEAAGKCLGIGLDVDGLATAREQDPLPPVPPQSESTDPAAGFLGSIAYAGTPATIERFQFVATGLTDRPLTATWSRRGRRQAVSVPA